MKPITRFSHAGHIGDIWASLPALKELHRKTGEKITLYLVSGQKAEFYAGATHPTKDTNGENVSLNQKMIDMMIPLLNAQPYIDHAEIFADQENVHELDAFRSSFAGLPHTPINRWYFYTYPDMSCDVTKKWLTVPPTDKNLCVGKVLINRTERYTSERINFEFLKPYEDECRFIGTQREWNNFCMNNDLNIKKLNVANFLEYAQAIQQSKFYISNQSQGFQLAQGMHHPRLLEMCEWASNVIVHGEDAFDFLSQPCLEYYFDYLYYGKSSPSDELLKKAEAINLQV